ncbi:hypothetical protein ABZ672_55320 [Streptomyces mirabilis]|nr:hypothetical protein [Streptomyces mirabilis]MCX4428599.1 hypothetical protein [Streptomyces mirabilis]
MLQPVRPAVAKGLGECPAVPRVSSSISIASVISRTTARGSRRSKQSAISSVTAPNAAVHVCSAIVASAATWF